MLRLGHTESTDSCILIIYMENNFLKAAIAKLKVI